MTELKDASVREVFCDAIERELVAERAGAPLSRDLGGFLAMPPMRPVALVEA